MDKAFLKEAFEAGQESGWLDSDDNMSREKSYSFEDWYHQVYELGVEFTNPIYREDVIK